MKTPSDASATLGKPTSARETPGYFRESRVSILRSRPKDVSWISEHLRDADRLDLKGKPAVTMLNHGLWESEEPLTLHIDGNPAAMFGVVPVKRTKSRKKYIPADSHWGAIWLLGTEDINKIPMTFLRESKKVMRYLTTEYDLVFNWVHVENQLHIRWIKWLGFQFMAQQGPFLQFAMVPNV